GARAGGDHGAGAGGAGSDRRGTVQSGDRQASAAQSGDGQDPHQPSADQARRPGSGPVGDRGLRERAGGGGSVSAVTVVSGPRGVRLGGSSCPGGGWSRPRSGVKSSTR